MVTRFSATDARLKAEQAKKEIEEQRLKEKELRKDRAKERAAIKVGFEKQKSSIISAAIDGQTEIEVDSVFLFKELVDSGLSVIEEGLVRRQAGRHEKKIDLDAKDKIKSEILNKFDDFVDAAKGDLKGYYDGFTRFHRLNYDALYEVINSDWRWSEFSGDDVYFEEVPEDLKHKYSDYMDRINEKIREYKEFGKNEEDENSFEEDSDELIEGEYHYSEEDDETSVLRPSREGNKLRICWTSEEGSTFMNAPLMSDVGLAWLTTYRGQTLIEVIFESLSNAAEMGKTSAKLDFSLSKDGWYFLFDGREMFSCMPDELVEIIAGENFTIDDTIALEKSYSIKVSW